MTVNFSVMTAATVSARAGIEIVLGWKATKFNRLGDVFLDGVLKLMQLFLGIHEFTRDRIVQQHFAVLFKVGYFVAAEGQGTLLLFIQRLSLGHDGLILAASDIVRHELVNPLPDSAHIWLGKNRAAQFAGFFKDHISFSIGRHKFWFVPRSVARIFSIVSA